jgi:hypothetical protein
MKLRTILLSLLVAVPAFAAGVDAVSDCFCGDSCPCGNACGCP